MMAIWSLNERAGGRAGVDLEHPSTLWVDDCLYAVGLEAEAMEEAMEDIHRISQGID